MIVKLIIHKNSGWHEVEIDGHKRLGFRGKVRESGQEYDGSQRFVLEDTGVFFYVDEVEVRKD